MHISRAQFLLVVFLSVALHAAAIFWAGHYQPPRVSKSGVPTPQERVIVLAVPPPPPAEPRAEPPEKTVAPRPARAPAAATLASNHGADAAPLADRPPAFMDAPLAPTGQEWAAAATYTLKNSKRYRYTWGQQVRSMMGTAVEGPDQGLVRFRVEIAPDGSLTRLVTLWSTSAVAEQRARKAMEHMPPLPPTPTGKPLIFEQTISFQAVASDGPPIYKNDCLPDPPSFGNPYAWDGTSPQVRAERPPPQEALDPKALEDCLKQLPRDSIEAEQAHDQRQLEQWASPKLGR